MAVFEFVKDFKLKPPGNKLRLPKEFVRQFRESLSDEVSLRPTFGVTWTIGLKRRDDKVWLRYGWPEFSRRFALDRGRFLFLAYQGNSEFSVSIFDNRTPVSQIYCDPSPARSCESKADADVEEHCIRGSSDNPIEILDNFDDDDKKVETRPPSNSTHKRMRTRAATRCLLGSNLDSENMDTIVAYGKLCDRFAAREWDTDGSKRSAVRKTTQLPSRDEKDMTKSAFEVTMTKSAVDNYRMYFPINFWKMHLNKRACDVILCGPGGESLTVQLRVNNKPDGNPSIRLCGPMWKKFAQDNNLTIGDRCIFDLTNSVEISFNVMISRSENGPDDHPSPVSGGETQGVNSSSDCEIVVSQQGQEESSQCPRQKIKSGQGKFRKIDTEDHTAGLDNSTSLLNPSFKAPVRKSCYSLKLPCLFAFNHMQKTEHTVMLEVGRRLWPVTFSVNNNECFLTAGYVTFLQQNSLVEGDVCKYELKEGTNSVFKVTILRGALGSGDLERGLGPY